MECKENTRDKLIDKLISLLSNVELVLKGCEPLTSLCKDDIKLENNKITIYRKVDNKYSYTRISVEFNLIATKCINGSKKINIKMKGFIGFEYSFDILDNDPKYEKMYSSMSSILKFYIMDKASICVDLLDEYFLK